MRKFLFSWMLLLASSLSLLFGQTNVIIGDTAGASSYFYGPMYRSSAGSSFNYNFYGSLLEASDLGIPSGTTINSISWKKSSANTITGGLADFTIRMKNTSASSFGASERYDSLTSATFTTVYMSTTQDITGGADSWVTFTLTTPFVYTGGSVIISTDWNRDAGVSNGAINWYYETKAGKAVGWASSAAPVATTTTTASYSGRRPTVRMNVTYPLGACIPPSGLGTSAITSSSAIAGWTTGGAANSLVEYGPAGFTLGTGTQMYVAATSASLSSLSANTSYDVYVKDSCVTNSSPWIGPHNFTTPCAGPMSGTYTINSGMPASSTNFMTFAAAASELNACGISGPVTINVVQGTYNEQITIDLVPGASMVNTVVFQPDASNTMPAVLTYGATGSVDNYVLKLKDAQYVNVQGLTLTATGASFGYVVDFEGNCSDIVLQDNIFNGVPTTSTSFNTTVIYNSSSTLDVQTDVTIKNNEINNGSCGIYWYGPSATPETNNSIDSNTIEDFYYYGIYSYYQDGVTYNGNTITQSSSSPYSTGYGIRNYYGDNSEVIGNTITMYATSTIYGIYNYFCDATSLSPNLVANNMVSCIGNSGTTYGIYAYNNYFTDIVYNSINVTAGSSTAGRALYLNSSTTGTYGFINLKNNNLVNTGGGYPVEVSSGAVTLGYVASSDYNNVYATGATVARVNNSNYASLLAYQAAVPTMDQNSVSANPLFNGPTDLHVSSPTLDGGANDYVAIPNDIDGDVRGVTPDIGADEFVAPTCIPSSGLILVTAYTDSATVAWDAGTGLTFNIEYGPAGFTPGSGMTATGIVDTFYTITGIASSSNYDFYIQDDCGAGDTSNFTGPGSFATLCGIFPAPFLETFTTTSTPNCWSQSATSGGPWVFTGTPDFGNTFAMLDHTNGVVNNYTWMDQSSGDAGVILEMPDVDVSGLTAPYLSYWIVSHTTSTILVTYNLIYVEAWDGLSWAVVDSVQGEYGLQWVEFRADLSTHTYGSNLVKLRFRSESGGDSRDYDNDMLLDDVTIDEFNTIACGAPQVAPYTESFDGSSTPLCWSQSATSGGPWVFSGNANSVQCSAPSDHTGNAGSYTWMDQSGGDAGVILQMPVVDVSALTVPYLELYYWMCGVNFSPVNKTYIETYDGSTWSVLDSITTSTAGWGNFGFDLSTAVYNTNLVQVRFRAESGGSADDYWGDNAMDDISILEAPTCFMPSALGATNVLANSADIYWITGGAANWNVEYDITGFTLGTGTLMAVTNDTLSLGSLLPQTTYQFYVQDSCGVGDLSGWSGPFSFTTPCSAIIPPSLEDFTTFVPACWDEADGGTPLTGPAVRGAGRWESDGYLNVGGTGAAKINMFTTGANEWILSPMYDLSTGLWNVEFDFAVYGWGTTSPASLGSDDQVQLLISIDNGSSWTNLATFDTSYVTAVGGNHEIFSLAPYAGGTVMFAIWATEGSINDPEDNDIFVDNFEVADFCANVFAPYTESFDGSTTPVCWSQSATSGGPWLFSGNANSVQCSAPSDHTGNAGSYAWMDQSGGDAGVILQMPEVNISALTIPYLDIYYWMCGVNYTPINKTYIEAYDGLVWTVFDSITTATAGWENFGYDLSTVVYNTDKVQIRFRAESAGSADDYWGDNSLDDVSIIEMPTCFLPSALGASNITVNSADIYWTTGGATDWNIEYGLSGFTPGTGTMMNATNDSVSLASLNASATYDFYVRDSCGAGDVSGWAGPFTFNTLCGVILPPSLEDFSTGFPPNCWDEAAGGSPLTGPTTLGTGGWTTDGFGNAGTTGAIKINLFNTGTDDWVLSPLYDLSGGIFNVEMDFAIYGWNSTSPSTLGSDDEVQLLISLDTGTTWTNLATFDSSYVTAPGGNHEVVSLAAYTGNIVMFGIWGTEGTSDDPEDNDIFVDNFEVKDPCATPITSYPWIEDFETSANSIPACWENEIGDDSDWIFRNGSIGHGATTDHTLGTSAGYYGGVDDSQASATDTLNNLLTPLFDLSSLTAPRLNFFYYIGNDNVLTSKLIIDVYDGAVWNLNVATINFTQTGWLQQLVDLTPYSSTSSQIRFRGVESADFNSDISIDDVIVEEAPTCLAPSLLGVDNVADISADLYWTAGGAANWNVTYGLAGFTPSAGTMVNATNDTISIASLTSGTQYEFYVRDSCAVGDVSAWVGPFAFTTSLCPLANACLYSITLADDFGDGWNGTEVTVYQGGTAVAVFGPNFTAATGNPPGDTLVVSLALCDNLLTEFVVTTGTNGLPNYTEEIGIIVRNPFNVQVAFYDNTATANQGDTVISFTSDCTPPGCIPPNALGSFNVTQNSADIFWTMGSVSATSIVEYGPVGFTPGTGTTVVATNDTINLASLMGSTTYTFCVTDSCGVGNISTTACANFTTACAIFNAPYTQTFDGLTRPVCWTDTATTGGPWVYGGNGTNSVNCAVAPDHTGNAGNYAWMDQSGGDAAVILAMPEVDVTTLTTPFLDFFYWMCGAGYTPANKTYLEHWDGASWVVFDSIVVATAGWEYFGYDLTGLTYGSNLVNIRFRAESGGSVNDFWGDNAIDDVSIREKPLCLDPTGLMVVSTTMNSVTLAWSSDTTVSGGAIEYGPTGFTPGSGIVVASAASGGTVINLVPGACYDFYATDSCGSSLLAWLGPVNGCTASPCIVSTTPTNVKGDTTSCGGGLVTLTASTTGNLAWMTGGEVVGTGSPFTPDSIFFTTNYTAYDYVISGPTVHVGPLPSIAALGFGNFTNGQWISVLDTITLDSTTVRANGYVNAQVWVQDPTQTRSIQRGAIFETDSNVTGNYQVPVGIVLTPGTYFVGIDFDVNAVSLGALFRATSGASYPYVAGGLMSIDSVNFAGPRYYYTFDMVVSGACLGAAASPVAIGYVPGANAGSSDSIGVCIINNAVNLASYIGVHDANGSWNDDNATGALTDSIFDASAVAPGTYNFTYLVSAVGGCGADSATVQVTVVNGGNAGVDTTAMACVTGSSIQLRNYVNGSAGGVFANLDNASGVIGGSLLVPGTAGPGTFRFRYTVPAGVCPADTAMVTVVIDSAANAGNSANDTICDSSAVVDLSTYIGASAISGGVWKDVNNSGGLTGSNFDPSAVAAGNTYILRYVVNNGCGSDSADVSIYVEDCQIGLSEYDLVSMEVYPNPTSGVVNIKSNDAGTEEITIELYTISGKLLMSREANLQEELSIDLSDFADGVYNLKITTENGTEVHRISKL